MLLFMIVLLSSKGGARSHRNPLLTRFIRNSIRLGHFVLFVNLLLQMIFFFLQQNQLLSKLYYRIPCSRLGILSSTKVIHEARQHNVHRSNTFVKGSVQESRMKNLQGKSSIMSRVEVQIKVSSSSIVLIQKGNTWRVTHSVNRQ